MEVTESEIAQGVEQYLENMISMIGLYPAKAIPTPMPVNPCSDMGVLIILPGYFVLIPLVIV